MTRVSREFKTMQMEAVPAVSADVVFATRQFPSYKIGANNEIIDVKDEAKISPLREAVARETALLLEQHKRLSVRDLAKKFEKGLVSAANLEKEDKLRDITSLEKHVILKRLRDSLESLNGRVVGKNKDDTEEAIALVEALAVQLTQREVELIQEKVEAKKLANILKQASEDAKKIIEEERAFARSEIEKAKEAVKRVEAAIQEQDRLSDASGKQDMDKLMKEVQEARRIKMLHQPSKVMDMEHELQALRSQLVEKHKQSLQIQKELAICRRSRDERESHLYELDGFEALGSLLQIRCTSDTSPELSACSAQWYRVSSDMSKELISGATKTLYAPEPFDVGQILLVEIISDGQLVRLTTTGPVEPVADILMQLPVLGVTWSLLRGKMIQSLRWS
uniref:Stomatal closure-related actin-binding protein 1 n=1 Tax=Kalanchoe fedtschenkoi TaxID=63787 RepID=A0A7N0UF41_KALFE